MLAQELVPGEAVAVEVQLPLVTAPLRARAIVRYQDKLRSGLEFVGLSADQRAAIRNWAKEAKAETQVSASPVLAMATKSGATSGRNPKTLSSVVQRPKKKRFGLGWTIFVVFVAFAAAVFWWRWNRGWEELESGRVRRRRRAKAAGSGSGGSDGEIAGPPCGADLSRGGAQGKSARNCCAGHCGGRDGSVVSMHALNGPEVLARAAMDALRWWKFEPYRREWGAGGGGDDGGCGV